MIKVCIGILSCGNFLVHWQILDNLINVAALNDFAHSPRKIYVVNPHEPNNFSVAVRANLPVVGLISRDEIFHKIRTYVCNQSARRLDELRHFVSVLLREERFKYAVNVELVSVTNQLGE